MSTWGPSSQPLTSSYRLRTWMPELPGESRYAWKRKCRIKSPYVRSETSQT